MKHTDMQHSYILLEHNIFHLPCSVAKQCQPYVSKDHYQAQSGIGLLVLTRRPTWGAWLPFVVSRPLKRASSSSTASFIRGSGEERDEGGSRGKVEVEVRDQDCVEMRRWRGKKMKTKRKENQDEMMWQFRA
uniref:Uncharacterized protein n=1 Tax=Musa acuminata TaxID=4641 RepID=Q1ENY5_MUSAC|nr:hypothetical protein MA4_111B14.4 [Musa acuminata]